MQPALKVPREEKLEDPSIGKEVSPSQESSAANLVENLLDINIIENERIDYERIISGDSIHSETS